MKRTSHVCLLVCAMLFFVKQHAQTFSISTGQLGIDEYLAPTNVGSGVSITDLDQNGWDDIFFGNSIDGNIVCYFNDQMEFTRTVIFEAGGDYKSTLAADYDNDGDMDILVTRDSGELFLLRNNGFQNFDEVSELVGLTQASLARSFGATWFDADNDGWLDLYVANYNSSINPNDAEIMDWFFHSNGDGTFELASNEFGFSQTLDATFQPSAFPYNEDEFLDVFTINDFLFSNRLYVSNSDGSYVASSLPEPQGFFLNAMSNAVCDFDNDGDYDVYITNTATHGNVFLKNNDGVFENVADEYNLAVNRFCVGAVWLDVDNDLTKDLFVGDAYSFDTFSPPASFQRDHLFRQENGVFESLDYIPEIEGAFDTYAVAKGDLNKDGFVDLVLSTSLEQGIQVLLNNADSGLESIRLNLKGVISNRDGIGTLIDCFIGGNVYKEVVQCGSEYLNQNSKTILLACGNFAQIDSICFKWSSGIEDVIYNIPSGNEIWVTEGMTKPSISQSASAVCQDAPVQLTLNVQDGSIVSWNDSQIGSTVFIDNPGVYNASIVSPDGFTYFSDTIEIYQNVEPEFNVQISEPDCWGTFTGTISLECQDCESIVWQNVVASNTLANLGAGTYSCEVTDGFGCSYQHEFVVAEPDPLVFFYTSSDATCFGSSNGMAKVEVVFGGQPPYSLFMDETILFENFTGIQAEQITLDNLSFGSYELVLMDANGCVVSEQLDISQPDPLTVESTVDQNMVEIQVDGGTPPYNFDWGVWGDLGSSATLENGFYTVEITDGNGCIELTQFDVNFISVDEIKDAPKWWWNRQSEVLFSEAIERVNVYTVQGQLIVSDQNCTRIDLERFNAQMAVVEGLTKQGVSFNIRIWVP